MAIKITAQKKPVKKSRKNVNTEKNARRLELIQKRLDAGLLSERFPDISDINIHIVQFYGLTDQVFMERTVNMVPGSNIYLLHIPCMEGNCVNGGFDLISTVEEMVSNNRRSGKGKMLCAEKDASGNSHSSISYSISIKYSQAH
ncbi:MAG: hypothetical protein M0Z61_00115 [Nitrospiraceae bacterium]|nr:hypothetical protein [Nitrospiraceae bacterium]